MCWNPVWDEGFAAEALAGFDHRLSVLDDWRAFLHNHAVFEHPSDPLNDRYILAVHNMAGAHPAIQVSFRVTVWVRVRVRVGMRRGSGLGLKLRLKSGFVS